MCIRDRLSIVFATNQLYVFVLFFCFITLLSRPFDTSIRFPGTLTLISILSGSSYMWSLHGHHKLAPSPWHEEATKGRPFLSFFHVMPPLHGGRSDTFGFPP